MRSLAWKCPTQLSIHPGHGAGNIMNGMFVNYEMMSALISSFQSLQFVINVVIIVFDWEPLMKENPKMADFVGFFKNYKLTSNNILAYLRMVYLWMTQFSFVHGACFAKQSSLLKGLRKLTKELWRLYFSTKPSRRSGDSSLKDSAT